MSGYLIIAVAFAYAYVAYEEGRRGNWPMVVVYCNYSCANVGLLWLHLRMGG
jgi:hypothetical protein